MPKLSTTYLCHIQVKKIISIFLLVLYASTSFAVAMDIHYCGSKYSGITFSNFDKAANCDCGQNGLHDRSCCTDKTICATTDNHKTVQQFWISPDFSNFTLPDCFTDVPVVFPRPASLPGHYSSSGYTRSHSPSFLTFLCTYLI